MLRTIKGSQRRKRKEIADEDEQMQKSKNGSRFQIAEGIGEKESGCREKGGIEIEGG